jgi:NAD(P)-dependent dehydrogenase (short-subunit alcohol dehydrogenase family)
MKNCFGEQILAGKVAFIAGGSSGINLGVAERLAEQGALVALLSRKPEKVQGAADGLIANGYKAMAIAADVRDYGALEAAFARVSEAHGPIDIVVSGAAGNFLAPAVALSANAFKTVVDIDLLGTFNVFRASYDHLRKPGASLIAITAPQAVNPMMFQIHACAAKAGVNMVTKCLAMEWGPAGIRVNGISPGPIADTEGMARLSPSPEAEAAFKQTIPLRAYGTKADIAEIALYLACDASQYVTGAIMDCDGGWSLGDASADALTVPPRG